jgi:hypothetical protein
MTPVAWTIVGIVVFDLFLALVVVRTMTNSIFDPIAAEFPARDLNTVFIERKRQSFSVGMMNFGFSIRVRLDDTYLHLSPEPWMRWTGMPAISIPLRNLSSMGSPRMSCLSHPIQIDSDRLNKDLRGPKWLWKELSTPN